jgi:hypothetical protein
VPPLWKVRRELLRLRQQLIDIPKAIFDRYLGTIYNDTVLAKRIQGHVGALPDGRRKAIYLIFPANGVQPSHIRTLRYLASKGLSVMVVSNLPLSRDDTSLICEHCNQYMERPNFGYDFGGYRDALLAISQDLSQLKQLVLMNDSVWFPLHEHTDWLDDVAALNVDFAGSVSHFGLNRVEPSDFRDFTDTFEATHKNFHYGSFALAIGPRILRDPAFIQFWQNLILTNNKSKTVKHGETGLTQWALKRGYTHADTLGVTTLGSKLSQLERGRLEHLARNVISFEDRRIRDAQKIVLAALPDLSRKELVQFLMTAGAFQGLGYVLAQFTVLELGYPFLKKSPLWLDPDAARVTMNILEALETPAAKEALKEGHDRYSSI